MNNTKEITIAIREMVTAAIQMHREGLLTTITPDSMPHATWMGAICTSDFRHLITLTGTETDKVTNIKANPGVEWMFTSPDRKTIVYLQGKAEIITDEEQKHRYIHLVPAEHRVPFTNYYFAGGEWCVIKTHIESAVYCIPSAYTKVRIGGHHISKPQEPSV